MDIHTTSWVIEFNSQSWLEVDRLTWFVLRTRYSWESKVASEILKLGDDYRSFCPVYRSTQVVRGQKTTIEVPLWTTYVLADWPDDGGYSWHMVVDIDGVTGVIGGEIPTPVQEKEVIEWVTQADSSGVITSMDLLLERIRRGYGRGDRVKIDGGPFTGVAGVCNWYDGSGTSVKTTLLGREVNIYAPLAIARVVPDDTVAALPKSRSRRDRRRILAEVRSI